MIHGGDPVAFLDLDSALTRLREDCQNPRFIPDLVQRLLLDKIPSGDFKTIGNLASTWFASGTNGMVYQKIIVDLPDLEPELLELLPLFCDIVTEVGVGYRCWNFNSRQYLAKP